MQVLTNNCDRFVEESGRTRAVALKRVPAVIFTNWLAHESNKRVYIKEEKTMRTSNYLPFLLDNFCWAYLRLEGQLFRSLFSLL